jgi:hypothetical protein
MGTTPISSMFLAMTFSERILTDWHYVLRSYFFSTYETTLSKFNFAKLIIKEIALDNKNHTTKWVKALRIILEANNGKTWIPKATNLIITISKRGRGLLKHNGRIINALTKVMMKMKFTKKWKSWLWIKSNY